jgi:hypothetical protein
MAFADPESASLGERVMNLDDDGELQMHWARLPLGAK